MEGYRVFFMPIMTRQKLIEKTYLNANNLIKIVIKRFNIISFSSKILSKTFFFCSLILSVSKRHQGLNSWPRAWHSVAMFRAKFDITQLSRRPNVTIIFSKRNDQNSACFTTLGCDQCDQIGRFIGLWATFQSLRQ